MFFGGGTDQQRNELVNRLNFNTSWKKAGGNWSALFPSFSWSGNKLSAKYYMSTLGGLVVEQFISMPFRVDDAFSRGLYDYDTEGLVGEEPLPGGM